MAIYTYKYMHYTYMFLCYRVLVLYLHLYDSLRSPSTYIIPHPTLFPMLGATSCYSNTISYHFEGGMCVYSCVFFASSFCQGHRIWWWYERWMLAAITFFSFHFIFFLFHPTNPVYYQPARHTIPYTTSVNYSMACSNQENCVQLWDRDGELCFVFVPPRHCNVHSLQIIATINENLWEAYI